MKDKNVYRPKGQKSEYLLFSQPLASIFSLSLCISLLFVLSGCGYSVQKKSDLPFDSILVGKIENKTVEPKLQDKFSKQLSETLLEYGFALYPYAQYILEGEIASFRIEPLMEKDLIATQYRVIIKAEFRIKDLKGNQVFPLKIDSPFIVYFSSFEGLERVLIAKDSATDKAIKDLAQEVVRFIIYKKYLKGS